MRLLVKIRNITRSHTIGSQAGQFLPYGEADSRTQYAVKKRTIMNTNNFETVKNSARHWYLLLILGIVFVLMGVWTLLTPISSLIALSIFFAVTLLVSGLFETIYAIANREIISGWGWNLAGGIIDLLIGFLLIANPGLSVVFLLFYVGFAMIFRATMTIGWAVQLNKLGFKNWGWLLATGITGLLFSFMLLWNPAVTGLITIIYLSVAFITLGIAQIIISFRIRKWIKIDN
ncbi:MAG: HdeD family acid-resistance protein [Saprospiraceae bacterium]|nr:HdeD family acid-resistance protein [Candidatus Parvibacillus calidus]MBX2937826.1 HdeD family acid-resistance protein [Saprospiraceae bacterium]HNC32832.1 HdeD family acid-resistance protein [Bacteroidia bacterium]HQV07025.1 HdeD family acid-resistance protein [Chitinophagaceae bacterium]MBX7178991.1 HdeD family acid-resistance protein [Saprospiraceae bacterium]